MKAESSKKHIILLGRKPILLDVLCYAFLNGVIVDSVVIGKKKEPMEWDYSKLKQFCIIHKIPIVGIDVLRGIEKPDYFLCVLYPHILTKAQLAIPKLGSINFHSAPLPDFGGFAPYTFGVYYEYKEWGVTAHFMDDGLDLGDIIRYNTFKILPNETAYLLEQRSREHLFSLCCEVIDDIVSGKELLRFPQYKVRVWTKQQFEELRKVTKNDTPEEIDRKIRAFWYPPYNGAYIEELGDRYTLINKPILENICNTI